MHHYIFRRGVSKSCWCFDPSAPVDSRISQIADMNYARFHHSIVVTNRKLYAIGGWAEILHIFIRNICQLRIQEDSMENCFNSIEEYDPQTNRWRGLGVLRNLPATRESAEKKIRTNRTKKNKCILS